MRIPPFKLERFFALYEFKVEILLSSSDCESLAMSELIGMAAPETRQMWDTLRLGYTESPGHPGLRAEIARQYAGIPADNLVVMAPEEAIFIAMHTLLEPGDAVVAVAPAYQSLQEVARALGCPVTLWPLAPTASGWQMDLDALERSLSPRTRLLVLNFPHNPTGFLPTRAEFEAVLALAGRHGITVFCDEMYRLLEHDPAARLPAVCEVYETGVSLAGLSKSFALPGLRIGWLAAQDPALAQRWLAFKDYTTICSSAPSEILAIMALQNSGPILSRNRGIVLHNTALAEDFCRAYPQFFEWIPPQAGSIAFPRWCGAEAVEDFCRNVLEEQGVMIVPGSLFDYPGNHFRVGLGRKNFAEGLARLRQQLMTRPA